MVQTTWPLAPWCSRHPARSSLSYALTAVNPAQHSSTRARRRPPFVVWQNARRSSAGIRCPMLISTEKNEPLDVPAAFPIGHEELGAAAVFRNHGRAGPRCRAPAAWGGGGRGPRDRIL